MADNTLQTHGQEYEQEYVHAVYEQIASHFSATRYKPWPIIAKFLTERPPGSIGLDVGCGNGKYLGINNDVFIIGSDRSNALVEIAAKHSRTVAANASALVVADILALPHAASNFDFAISIAVVHHFSTLERRIEAMVALLEVLRPKGQVLVYVWALEQETSRRGWSADDDQDVLVPWVTRNHGEGQQTDAVFKRYYHLYRKGELEESIQAAGGVVLESGYEKDNWWAIAMRHTEDSK